jgi:hypothetical protein
MDYGRDADKIRGSGEDTEGVEGLYGKATASSSRLIVYAGLTAAAYAVITIGLAPISYGPVQFRVASLLKPLALVSPVMCLGLSIGVGLANLTSPFGAYDFLIMPVVSLVAALIAYSLRRLPWLAMVMQAALIAAGVAIFPLHMGAGIPIWPTALFVFVPECALYLAGYAALRKTPLMEVDQC